MSEAASLSLPHGEIARHLDTAPFGYALLRADGGCVYVNATVAAWLGASVSEVLRASTFKHFLTAPSRIYFETHVAPLLAMHGSVAEIAVDLLAADHQRVPVLLNASLGQSAGGAPLTQLALQRVEERRRYETELLSERRRAEDALAELQAAQTKVVELSQLNAMSTLSSSLAHEINQPLTVIVNMLGGMKRLLQSNRASPLLEEALEGASAAALQAGGIIRQIRALSRGSTARHASISVSEIIDRAVQSIAAASKRPNIVRLVGLSPPTVRVAGNPDELHYVLRALIENAVEAAASADRPSVEISGHELADGMLQIAVRDNGSGVPPDVRSRLFTAFVSTKPGHRGISLANCRTVVEAYGGRIWMEPTSGPGAEFVLSLPVDARKEA